VQSRGEEASEISLIPAKSDSFRKVHTGKARNTKSMNWNKADSVKIKNKLWAGLPEPIAQKNTPKETEEKEKIQNRLFPENEEDQKLENPRSLEVEKVQSEDNRNEDTKVTLKKEESQSPKKKVKKKEFGDIGDVFARLLGAASAFESAK
jgi:hypothetical protein